MAFRETEIRNVQQTSNDINHFADPGKGGSVDNCDFRGSQGDHIGGLSGPRVVQRFGRAVPGLPEGSEGASEGAESSGR